MGSSYQVGVRWLSGLPYRWPVECLSILAICVLLGISSDTAKASTWETAEAATTKNDIYALREAIRNFQKEYKIDPPSEVSLLLRLLLGASIGGYNPIKIVFWEPRSVEKSWWNTSKGGVFDGPLMDGWGRPFVFEWDPRTGRLEVWSRLKDGTADKASAQRHELQTVLLPGRATP